MPTGPPRHAVRRPTRRSAQSPPPPPAVNAPSWRAVEHMPRPQHRPLACGHSTPCAARRFGHRPPHARADTATGGGAGGALRRPQHLRRPWHATRSPEAGVQVYREATICGFRGDSSAAWPWQPRLRQLMHVHMGPWRCPGSCLGCYTTPGSPCAAPSPPAFHWGRAEGGVALAAHGHACVRAPAGCAHGRARAENRLRLCPVASLSAAGTTRYHRHHLAVATSDLVGFTLSARRAARGRASGVCPSDGLCRRANRGASAVCQC